jgi:hypothetical protein
MVAIKITRVVILKQQNETMKKKILLSFFILLSSLLQGIYGKSHADVPTWKAGVAATVITPREPMWMGGYSSRTTPTERKVHDLWAKALYLLCSYSTCKIKNWI